MFQPDTRPDPFAAEDGIELLRELERNTSAEIRRQRAKFRIDVRARVTLLPGSLSEALSVRMQAMVGDISEGGCRVLAPLPLRVGDIYRMQFDQSQLQLPLTFARCLRCSMLREDAFEAGFSFFTPIELPESIIAAHSGTGTGSMRSQ